MIDNELVKRWRLILGKGVEDKLENLSGQSPGLSEDQLAIDEALAAIYDDTGSGSEGTSGAGLGKSRPKIARWLGDVRQYFPEDVVSVIQSDAIERKGLTELLFEPELLKNVKPSIDMVATLIALKGRIPEKTKATARELVRAVVEEINKKLAGNIRRAVAGALNKKRHSPIPSATAIDWKYTINRNLKNYNEELKKIIPERVFFFDRAKRTNDWTIILDMDMSGSMAESVIYGSIIGSIFASIPALKTHVVAFDTQIVDLTDKYDNDPVDMLFGIQLGGGTDINKSVAYCEGFIKKPAKTIFILLTDLFEGGNQAALTRRLGEIHESGVKTICLLALSDAGTPAYNDRLAKKIAAFGIPCFSCTPALLPDFLEGVLKNKDLVELARTITRG